MTVKALTGIMKAAEELGQMDGDNTQTPQLVCFVCTGNTCRSPMAEAVLNSIGGGRYRGISAGLSVCHGDRIAENAVSALERAGIESTPDNNYKGHIARQLTRADALACDKLVAMTPRHMIYILSAFPELAEKVCAMPVEIPDPYMQSEAVYDKCLEMITEGIKDLFGLDR